MDGGSAPRKATARCLDESELLFVSGEGFEEVKRYATQKQKVASKRSLCLLQWIWQMMHDVHWKCVDFSKLHLRYML